MRRADLSDDPDHRAAVASYFNVAPEIAHLVPELLADLHELGSFPDRVLALLRPLDLPAGARVLDLGCGKGAVSLALVQELGLRAEGVDMVGAFIDEARARAGQSLQGLRCRYHQGDIKELLADPARQEAHDVVLYISVGEALGDLEASVARLRRVVRPGGYMVIDDGFLCEDRTVDLAGYELCTTHEQSLDRLTAHGDQIVVEELFSPLVLREQNEKYMSWIEARAAALSGAHPEHARAIEDYLAREREEVSLLENHFTCATWLLQKLSAA